MGVTEREDAFEIGALGITDKNGWERGFPKPRLPRCGNPRLPLTWHRGLGKPRSDCAPTFTTEGRW